MGGRSRSECACKSANRKKWCSAARASTDGASLNEKATAWVVRMDDQDVVAFTPQCTHLGCAYHWESKRNYFLCPCHTSVFSIDGKVIGGPAPRPLDRYVTRIDSGKLLIGSEIQKSA